METTNNNKFPLYSKDDIPPEWIDIGEQIGSGEYGEVFEGKLKVPGGIEMIVAVKTLKEEMMEVSKHDFLREARVMMDLEHNNIVRLIGVSWNVRQIYMVQELLSLGSLQEYLVDHRDEISADPHIRLWAHQISKGLVYLTEKLIVHRDLAARNILLSSSAVAKIGDFGLSRALNLESNYYTASKGGKWPIKWYAPESCTHGTFSHASDVWSFGITLWEMYSYGEIPYGDLQGMEVIELVGNGYRLEKPEECPDAVFDVIQRCWSERAEDRPTFRFLEEFFAN
jgi:tyrosine-protein kinase